MRMLSKYFTLCIITGFIAVCFAPSLVKAIVISPAQIQLDIESGKQTVLTLQVTNDTSENMTVVPEVEAYTIDDLRRPHFGAVDMATAWIRPSSVEVSIAPGKQVDIFFPVFVPVDAEPKTHLIGLFVRQIAKKINGENVFAGARGGALLTLQVAGQPLQKMSIEKISAPSFSFVQKIPVTVSIKNSGTVSTQFSGEIFASNLFGRRIAQGKLNPNERQILPDTIKNDSFILDIKSWESIGPINIQTNIRYGDPEQVIIKKILLWHIPLWSIISLGFILIIFGLILISFIKKRKQS
ncbi:MAG: hypothetical protein KBD73_00295 [Candidatus Magasanikbacteria bacterium]|nr:hypothetical protein [Candidatus Magasanikbacteria bacterium]